MLWGLEGQKAGALLQLGSGVLECLRRVDDIAYLRWATHHKHLGSLNAFVNEAWGRPSTRLLAYGSSWAPRVPAPNSSAATHEAAASSCALAAWVAEVAASSDLSEDDE